MSHNVKQNERHEAMTLLSRMIWHLREHNIDKQSILCSNFGDYAACNVILSIYLNILKEDLK